MVLNDSLVKYEPVSIYRLESNSQVDAAEALVVAEADLYSESGGVSGQSLALWLL